MIRCFQQCSLGELEAVLPQRGDPEGPLPVCSKSLHAVCLYQLKTAHDSLNNSPAD